MFLAGCTTDHAGADSPRGVGPGLAAGETASHPRLATGQQQFLDKYTDPAGQDGTMYKVLTGPGLSLQDFGASGLVRPGGKGPLTLSPVFQLREEQSIGRQFGVE